MTIKSVEQLPLTSCLLDDDHYFTNLDVIIFQYLLIVCMYKLSRENSTFFSGFCGEEQREMKYKMPNMNTLDNI